MTTFPSRCYAYDSLVQATREKTIKHQLHCTEGEIFSRVVVTSSCRFNVWQPGNPSK